MGFSSAALASDIFILMADEACGIAGPGVRSTSVQDADELDNRAGGAAGS